MFRLLRMTRVNATDHPVRISAPTNRYEPTTVFEAASLAVEDGQSFGFLDPNGVGKTALLNRTRDPWYKLDDTTAIGSQGTSTWRETREQPVPREATT